MTLNLKKKNLLEESLSKLDLQSTIVLLNLLASQALMLQQAEAKKANITRLMKPDTAIKLPQQGIM